MRILLVGEFSGFHNNLKKGLQKFGHEVVLAASGDGFKKLPFDINIGSDSKGVLGKLHRIISALSFLNYAKNFDVVQFVNPDIFPKGLSINQFMLSIIIKRNRKSVLAACGDDYAFVTRGCKKMRYSPIPDSLLYDHKVLKHPLDGDPAKRWWYKLVSKVDAVIPVMYEYELGYHGIEKLQDCIPLPIDISETIFVEMPPLDVITIFHGDNRYGFKGTRYVEEAFQYLRKKYPNKLELIIAGQIPLNEYLTLMRRTHIVIDQVNSYSCGMNALYAMAMGKIVLGGAEPEGLDSLRIPLSPVINITQSAESIIQAVEMLINDHKKIIELGRVSRAFIENYHCSVKVAQQYLNVWQKL